MLGGSLFFELLSTLLLAPMSCSALSACLGPRQEFFRTTWNDGCYCDCVAEHNQCPPRCLYLCPEPPEEDVEPPEEPDFGVPMRMDMTIEDWQGFRQQVCAPATPAASLGAPARGRRARHGDSSPSQ